MSATDTPRRAIVLLACSIVLSTCAQLLMKAGMLALADDGVGGGLLQVLQAVMRDSAVSGYVGAGLLCYALSMLAWLMALTGYSLSIAYPMLGISYVLVYLGAVLWERIGEDFSLVRSAGIVLVLIGVILVNYRDSCGDSADIR